MSPLMVITGKNGNLVTCKMYEEIFLIDDISNLEDLKKFILTNKNTKIFALDYIIHSDLQKNNISHQNGEEYLTSGDHIIIDDSSIKTTLSWYMDDNIKDNLTFYDINLGTLLEAELIFYFLTIYRNLLTVKRIIEKEKPEFVAVSTKINDFVERLCKKQNIRFIKYERKTLTQIDKFSIDLIFFAIPISFHISRNKFLKIKNFLDHIINSIFNFSPNYNDNKKSILLLDFDPVRYNTLMKELSKLDKQILLLNQRRSAVWNLESLKVVKNTKCKIVNLSDFEKTIKNSSEEITKKLNEITKTWTLDSIFEKIFSIENETFWYSIKDSFVSTCNARFKESVRRIIALTELFERSNISGILNWAETAQEEKEVLFLAKKRDIKSMVLQHALYPTTGIWNKFARFLAYFSYPTISNKQAMWGELTKKFAQNHGYNENSILITGSPRHDKFFDYTNLAKNENSIIIATTGTSATHSQYTTTQSRIKYDKIMIETINIAKKFNDKKLIIKLPPHQEHIGIARVEDVIKEHFPEITILRGGNLIEIISSCELLITFNNSTIALEAMLLNKPTISIQTEDWLDDEEIVQMGALLSISNINEIEDGIKKILTDTEFRINLKNKSRIFIEKYFANKGQASKILAQKLDEL